MSRLLTKWAYRSCIAIEIFSDNKNYAKKLLALVISQNYLTVIESKLLANVNNV